LLGFAGQQIARIGRSSTEKEDAMSRWPVIFLGLLALSVILIAGPAFAQETCEEAMRTIYQECLMSFDGPWYDGDMTRGDAVDLCEGDYLHKQESILDCVSPYDDPDLQCNEIAMCLNNKNVLNLTRCNFGEDLIYNLCHESVIDYRYPTMEATVSEYTFRCQCQDDEESPYISCVLDCAYEIKTKNDCFTLHDCIVACNESIQPDDDSAEEPKSFVSYTWNKIDQQGGSSCGCDMFE
jgi:hypothetical protein